VLKRAYHGRTGTGKL